MSESISLVPCRRARSRGILGSKLSLDRSSSILCVKTRLVAEPTSTSSDSPLVLSADAADKFKLTKPKGPSSRTASISVTVVSVHFSAPECFVLTQQVYESGSRGPVESAIHDKLTTLLRPSRLTITNESHLHRHHAAMRAQGGGSGETHFGVQIISEAFKGKTTLQRHRMIYSALSDELGQGLHALSLKTTTPEETAGQLE